MLTRRCMEFHPFSLDSAWISLGKFHISQRSIFGSRQMFLVIGKCPSRLGLSTKIEEPKSPFNSLHFGMFIAVEELVLLAHLYNIYVHIYIWYTWKKQWGWNQNPQALWMFWIDTKLLWRSLPLQYSQHIYDLRHPAWKKLLLVNDWFQTHVKHTSLMNHF